MTDSFKEGDSVQLKHGNTFTMTISEIDERTKEAKCVWLDSKKGVHVKDWLPLNVLKHTPKKKPLDLPNLVNRRNNYY